MIDGCLDWQQHGLLRPASVTKATEDYFAEQDLLSQWLDEECDVDPTNENKWISTAELFKSWSDYAKAAAEPAGSTKTFAPALRRHGLRQKSNGKAKGWRGIRLKPLAERGDYGFG